jgi:bifunctional DNA-binding transcriptional regulator/antitoxin component of YhaV-PrlF toxin-antitoxin module
MKSTGMVRKIDELGRVVIPMELRRTMGIDEKDPLENLCRWRKNSAAEVPPRVYLLRDYYRWNHQS